MNLADFLKTWDGALLENKFHRISLPALSLAMVIAVLAATNVKERVVLQPMTLSDEAWIEETSASREYMEAWGDYLGQLLGNVTPQRIGFIKARLEPLLAPGIFSSAMETIEEQAQIIKENRLSYRFEPKHVEYEINTGKIFSYGYSYVKAATGDEQRSEKTYEFVIDIKKYIPSVVSISVYEGKPRTEKVLIQLENKAEREAEKAQR